VAEDDLARLDRPIAQRIVDKVENHLVKDPLKLGKPLLFGYKGYHRYQVLKD
jgi:mRNA-degrading endonuclease RelE of RelBE toxin-antitoxin system